MKILATGDWHIRAKNPKYRIDNYYETLIDKIKWIFELAEKNNCVALIQPGDFFDSPDQANYVSRDLIALIHKYDIDIYSVYGQHDQKFRNSENTIMSVLAEAKVINILSKDPISYSEGSKHIELYGASWDESIPTPLETNNINILAAHKMVVGDKPLWADQKDYTKAKSLLLKHSEYDLIITGDNHQAFTYGKNFGSMLLNCGSLMRTTIAQRNHKPVVYIVDTNTSEVIPYYVPVKPIEEVMNLELADETKERNEDLDAFMKGLSSEYDVELNFEDNLKNVIIENDIVDRIKDITNDYIRRYYDDDNRSG